MIFERRTVNQIVIFLLIIFLLQLNSQAYAMYSLNNATRVSYNFNNIFVKDSVFEWKIQNVEFNSSIDELPINNNDILSVKLLVDLSNYNFSGIYENLIYYTHSYDTYEILINGEPITNELYLYLLQCDNYDCLTSYQIFFGLKIPLTLNDFEPHLFYPLECVNNSITIPYFENFYNILTQKSEQMENVEITKKKKDKFLEIGFSQYKNDTYYEITSVQLISINIEVGILGFYRINYCCVDKQNTSRFHQFSYEIISNKFGYRAFRAGIEPVDFILISSFSVLCMLYYLKKNKKKKMF